MNRKGVILARGSGTRLYPLTKAVAKLMPVYDKRMIHYPLSVLIMGGIRYVMVIDAPKDRAAFESLLGDGSDLGMEITYEVQNESGVSRKRTRLVLTSSAPICPRSSSATIFYGRGLTELLDSATRRNEARWSSVPCRQSDRLRRSVIRPERSR